jgi:DNA-binding MarR family transcriptional regulator
MSLVKRSDDPADGRSVRVSLTRKGRTMVDRAIPTHQDNLRSGMDRLTIEERRQLVDLLRKVAGGFEEHFG